MGPDAIELIHELVKALLLGQEIARCGPGRCLFQGAMHAFMAAVLPRTAPLDPLWNNAQGYPPDTQTTETTHGTGGKWCAIVREPDLCPCV